MNCSASCQRPTPAQAHCGACHVTFGGVSGFDRHRRAGMCLDPATCGLVTGRRGVWVFPVSPEDQERLRAIRG